MNPAHAQQKNLPSASSTGIEGLGGPAGHLLDSVSLLDARQLDDLLDKFESQWQPNADFLLEFVKEHGLTEHPAPLSEFLRADIDRRYAAREAVDLTGYFQCFPALLTAPVILSEIAFEDYRARQSRRLSLEPERWSWIEGVQAQPWFRELGGVQLELARCGSSLAFPVKSDSTIIEPTVGQRFGDFHLIGLLGTGTFSQVFLARQISLANRHVAIKVVRRPLAEPVHMARMQHTGIVPLFSFHRIGEYSVLCMPYAGATTLSDWIKFSPHGSSARARHGQSFVETVEALQQRVMTNACWVDPQQLPDEKPLGWDAPTQDSSLAISSDERTALAQWNESGSRPLHLLRDLDTISFSLWFAQRVASALAHAHARGIVHGDLKPANILVRNDGEPALIDFNLSRDRTDGTAEYFGGTLPYMAPEQLRSLIGCHTPVTPASDVYSLGVVLYELIEGAIPHPSPRSAAESDLLLALSARQKAKLNWSSQNASPGLQSIVTKCLHFDAADRYSDASKLLEDLDAEKLNLPLQHAAESLFRSRIPKAIRRYPRLASGTILLLVCSVIIATTTSMGFSWWHQSQMAARAVVASLDEQVHLLLPELIEADLDQLPKRIHDSEQTLYGMVGDINQISKAEFFGWLNANEQSRVKELVFDHTLVTATVMLERAGRWNEDLLHDLETLISRCEQFPELAAQSDLLSYFQKKIENEKSTLRRGSTAGSLGIERLRKGTTRPVETILEARILLALGEASRANERLATLDEIPSHELLFWITNGQSQLRTGQASAARLSFTVAIRLAPTSALCYAYRAEACSAMRDSAAALGDYTRAIELDPKNVNHLASRAFVYEQRNELPEAIQDLSDALARKPDSNRLLLIRYRLQQALGNVEAANEDYRLAMRQQPGTVQDWISRALAHAHSSPAQALLDLQQAEKLKPGDLDVLQNMAYVQAELLGDISSAIACLDKILVQQPQHEMARGGRCVLHARLQQQAEALQDIDYLLKYFPEPLPATVYQIACAHALLSPLRPQSRIASLQYLRRAALVGYGLDLLDSDPDLASVRDDEEFKQLRAISTKLVDTEFQH